MAGLKKRRKKIKKSKKIKELDSFDYLVVFALFHTLWHSHKTGNGIIATIHCSTDKHIWMLIIMYTNGYNSIPVMAGLKKRRKKN